MSDAKQATPEEMYQSALNHYNRLSDKACDFHSAIPHALQCYFFEKPKLEAKAAAFDAIVKHGLLIAWNENFGWIVNSRTDSQK